MHEELKRAAQEVERASIWSSSKAFALTRNYWSVATRCIEFFFSPTSIFPVPSRLLLPPVFDVVQLSYRAMQ
jgi:hypothetical protein